jgi:hypothetical protein
MQHVAQAEAEGKMASKVVPVAGYRPPVIDDGTPIKLPGAWTVPRCRHSFVLYVVLLLVACGYGGDVSVELLTAYQGAQLEAADATPFPRVCADKTKSCAMIEDYHTN